MIRCSDLVLFLLIPKFGSVKCQFWNPLPFSTNYQSASAEAMFDGICGVAATCRMYLGLGLKTPPNAHVFLECVDSVSSLISMFIVSDVTFVRSCMRATFGGGGGSSLFFSLGEILKNTH